VTCTIEGNNYVGSLLKPLCFFFFLDTNEETFIARTEEYNQPAKNGQGGT
jgi:hypothetical protein